MKFLIAVMGIVIPIAVAAGGILWATGNINVVTEPTTRFFQETVGSLDIKPPRWAKWPGVRASQGNVAINTASISPSEAAKRLAKMPDRKPFDSDIPVYDRDEWGDWYDLNADCRNTRADVLAQESFQHVKYPNGCTVSEGRWEDPWSGRKFDDASQLDVDHHVPVANAHYSGGYAWSRAKKQEYYNDTKLSVALNAISSIDNRAKGAAGPHRWKPALRVRHCAYATGWIAVKSKYGLSVTPNERNALTEMLRTCSK